MIYKNIKPRKLATIEASFDSIHKANSFSQQVKELVASRTLRNPTSATSIADIINSVADKFTKKLGDVFVSPRSRDAEVELLNLNIHALDGQTVKLFTEIRISDGKKLAKSVDCVRRTHKVNLDFYALDERAYFGDDFGWFGGRKIIVPYNSVVYQVNSEEKFKAYEKDGVVHFLRTSKDMNAVDIVKFGNNFYKMEGDDVLRKVEIVDNTDAIKTCEIKAERVSLMNRKSVDEYVSFTGKEINIAKKHFNERATVLVENLNGETLKVTFKKYKLSEVNKALKDVVRAVEIDGDVYLSNTKV